MYAQLQQFNQRPQPFSILTAPRLWQDPHLAGQMLQAHLDESVEAASRPKPFRDASLSWMQKEFKITQGSKVLDLGCGPGLFAQGFAQMGATVTGVYFSRGSIAYAKEQANLLNLQINYLHQDYLGLDLDDSFDLITLIYFDYCALSPEQRQTLLGVVRKHLREGGRFVFDVFSARFLENSQEVITHEKNPAGGFWSAKEAFVFHNRFLYPEESLYLDQYHILEESRSWAIFNWLQCFTPETLSLELTQADLAVEAPIGDLTGATYHEDTTQFALSAKKG